MPQPKMDTMDTLESEGNTVTSLSKKRTTQKLYYSFTVHNYEQHYEILLKQLMDISNKGILGKEICPTTGNKHLQGWIALKKRMRITEFKLCIKPHFEASRGNEEQNIKYCSKENNFITWGLPKPIKTISSLYDWQQKILDIYLTEPDDRTIYWFWEETGNIGKTAFIKFMVVHHKILFCNGGKYSDIINLVFNQNMDTCNAVMFDIPRCHNNKISYASLESIKNGMVCNTKYETGTKIFNPPHVFIFANFAPDENELSIDRWVITKL